MLHDKPFCECTCKSHVKPNYDIFWVERQKKISCPFNAQWPVQADIILVLVAKVNNYFMHTEKEYQRL